ncbi:amidohydrolase [Acidobacteria bacterium AH-259-D05]|nr:amidohydrolase [Acidobacteria bacterium AH-259-D05]
MGKSLLPKMVLVAIGTWGMWSCTVGPRLDEPAEAILFNGKIVTVDQDFSYAQALAVRDGKILAVGSDEEIEGWADSNTRWIDLQGKTVIPGLADNHLHAAGGGPGVDLSRVRTMEELLEAIGARVKQSEPGELITTNSDWHEAQLKEQRLPLRRDLEKVAPENPVVVVRGGHEYILNSAALKKWNITRSTPVPEAGRISRYEDGELNGELVDAAKRLVDLPPPPAKDLEERIQDQLEEHQKLHAVGLTSIRHPGAPIDQYQLLQEIKRRGQLTMRVNFLLRMRRGGSGEGVAEQLDAWTVQPDEGDEWLRIGGVKLGVDGGFEGGWMREPYAEPWGRDGTFYGLQTVPQETYTAVVKELGQRGWRVATHAVGDAAIDQVLTGYEEANRDQSIVGRRWTIEHGFIPQPDQFPRMKQLGLVVSGQNHLYVAGPSLEKYWGRQRANWVTPMRAYLDNDVMVSAGTDSPVVPYPPLWVIYHFVTRDTISGGVFGEDQRISREEALRIITINNAYLTFEEEIKGSLEPGKLADLVVLSEDIMTCPEEDIANLSVLMTMVGGQVVYQDEDFLF